MKKIMNWVIAATLICSASVFTACSEKEDNPNEQAKKDRKEFIEHTRNNLKLVANNLNFKTWNSLNYFVTGFNEYIVLNDDFEKAIGKTFAQKILTNIKPFEFPEGVKPENIPDDIPEALLKDFKYVALIDLTDFNYTFTATQTGFDVAENDDKGLEILVPNLGDEDSNIENISVAIKGTGDTYSIPLSRFSNDSVLVIAQYPAQFDLALSTKSAGIWTKNLYGTIKNTIQSSVDILTPEGATPTNPILDIWNIALELHANIPNVDGFDLNFAIGQNPETHKASMMVNYVHNGYPVLDATATLTNANGMTDLSEITSSTSLMDIFSAIMAGNSVENLQLTLLDDLTTNLKISDCSKVMKIQSEMARARRNYADQQTIAGYVGELNDLISCSMACKGVNQQIPMRLVTTQIGVDWWAVPGLNFADENGYVPMTELLDKESIEYAFNIIDHAVDPAKNSIVVARQLVLAVLKLRTALNKAKAQAE